MHIATNLIVRAQRADTALEEARIALRAAELNLRMSDLSSKVQRHFCRDDDRTVVVEEMICRGANQNIWGKDGFSAIHEAARLGQQEICRMYGSRGPPALSPENQRAVDFSVKEP
jgi:hypothetical protein